MSKCAMLEGELGLDVSSDEVYPNAVVKISRDQYSAFEIKRMIEETKELDVAPEFQRNKVWKHAQKCELIESILMGIPIPVIYMFENENGTKQLVDGRQRISAIVDFMNDCFKLGKLSMLPSFDGKTFSKMEPIYKSKLERYQLFVYVIEPPTPERVKYDIFDRVNRGGTQLNNQEMRNALYYGAATRLLKKLSKMGSFKKATGCAIKANRMRDQYVILRSLSFYLWQQGEFQFDYKSNMDDFLAASMKYLNQLSDEKLQQLVAMFDVAMQRSYHVLGEDAFRFAVTNVNRRPINMALFEVLSYFFAITNTDGLDLLELKGMLLNLKQELDDSGYFAGRVDSSVSVEARFAKVEHFRMSLLGLVEG